MKTTKENILMTSLELFAARGFDAVSTSMIASELGITKGALYRHFDNKQAILDSIIDKMFSLDEKQANKNRVPAKEYEADKKGYQETALHALCSFVNDQLLFWTENEFARLFRRMLTIEQFRNPEMTRLYQDVIGVGPVRYTEKLFEEMLNNGQLNSKAEKIGAWSLAVKLFAPLKLSIQLYDGGMEMSKIKSSLKSITSSFEEQYKT